MTSNSNNSNPISRLETAYECSISGVFQELLSKGFKTSAPLTTTTEPLKVGDSEGSDFKRLLHKKDTQTTTNNKTAMLERSSSITSTTSTTRKQYHQDSPDFRPAVHLENSPTPSPSTSSRRVMTTLYSLFFQSQDRYFISDRDELSKDIFPVGQAH